MLAKRNIAFAALDFLKREIYFYFTIAGRTPFEAVFVLRFCAQKGIADNFIDSNVVFTVLDGAELAEVVLARLKEVHFRLGPFSKLLKFGHKNFFFILLHI